MPLVDSRLGPGTLTIGTPGKDYAFQVSACTLTPNVNSTDGVPTLAVPEPPPETKTDYSLDGDAINDFTDPQGLSLYCFDNDGLEMAFVWVPITADGTSLAGNLIVRAFPIGGKPGEMLQTTFSWPVVGKPTWTPGALADEGATRKMEKAK